MAMQNLRTAPRIGAARLREVWDIFEDACWRLEAMDIPDALIHSDINLGNILVGDEGCVFVDWANAGVGNPFVTYEQLRIQLAQERSTQAWVPRLTEIYQEVWRLMLPNCQIECAFTLVPIISAASYLYSRKDWITAEHGHNPQLQSYARSLVRQMERAAQAIELNHERCA
jgi:Ser/Thr protein kinase RdoA (MazF antagonist)